MLTELRISNFAVIDRLVLNFSSGFHVFTGETGAGKSIIVDAIALLIGGRASADQIRSDADEAVLEASFALPSNSPLIDRLHALDLLQSGEHELIIRRILSRAGRHRVYVNGVLTPLHILQGLAGTLIDIHGQHEQQSLLSSQSHLEVLDAFGHLNALRESYEKHYAHWTDTRRQLEETKRIAEERKVREDLLRFQYHELIQAELRPGEEDALTAEHHRLAHVRRLAELHQEVYESLYGSDTAILSGLGVVADRLRELEKIDAQTSEWPSICEAATAHLRELALNIRAYREQLDEDPERLTGIEDRLDRLGRLRKKYGTTVDSLIVRTGELKRQLDELNDAETRVAEMQAALDQAVLRLRNLAGTLSARRHSVARDMEARVEAELAALQMEHTRFRIHVQSDENGPPGPTGWDHVECLLSANPGEPLHPLARIASGGELSRIMLAIKTVLAETDRVPVLIFDEVDAGIGGAVAAVMGRRLRALSGFHQVFCITHLPQIASQARTHFRVQKTTIKKRTVTRVTELGTEDRQEEVARMLGGLAITKAARATAAEMIKEADMSRDRPASHLTREKGDSR